MTVSRGGEREYAVQMRGWIRNTEYTVHYRREPGLF